MHIISFITWNTPFVTAWNLATLNPFGITAADSLPAKTDWAEWGNSYAAFSGEKCCSNVFLSTFPEWSVWSCEANGASGEAREKGGEIELMLIGKCIKNKTEVIVMRQTQVPAINTWTNCKFISIEYEMYFWPATTMMMTATMNARGMKISCHEFHVDVLLCSIFIWYSFPLFLLPFLLLFGDFAASLLFLAQCLHTEKWNEWNES